jgi:hypothetical protein
VKSDVNESGRNVIKADRQATLDYTPNDLHVNRMKYEEGLCAAWLITEWVERR